MKNQLFKDFAKEHQLDEDKLVNLYNAYSAQGSVPRDDLADLAKVERVDGESVLDNLRKREGLRSTIEDFVSLVHKEFGNVEQVKVQEVGKEDLVSTDGSSMLEKLEKELAYLNGVRWELSDKHMNTKYEDIAEEGSNLFQFNGLLREVENSIGKVDYTLDNFEYFVEEGSLTPPQANPLKREFRRLEKDFERLKNSLVSDIKKEARDRDFQVVKGDSLFKELLKREGLSVSHRYSQDLASFLVKHPIELREPFIKGRLIGSELLEESLTILSVMTSSEVSAEDRIRQSKGTFEKAFSLIEEREAVVNDVYELVSKAHNAENPTALDREIVNAWKDNEGIKYNFMEYKADNINSKEELKRNLRELNVLKHRELAKEDRGRDVGDGEPTL